MTHALVVRRFYPAFEQTRWHPAAIGFNWDVLHSAKCFTVVKLADRGEMGKPCIFALSYQQIVRYPRISQYPEREHQTIVVLADYLLDGHTSLRSRHVQIAIDSCPRQPTQLFHESDNGRLEIADSANSALSPGNDSSTQFRFAKWFANFNPSKSWDIIDLDAVRMGAEAEQVSSRWDC